MASTERDDVHGLITSIELHGLNAITIEEKDKDEGNINFEEDFKNEIEGIEVIPLQHKEKEVNMKENDEIIQKYTLLEDDKDLEKPLDSPYKKDLYHKMSYYFETFLVVNPRIYALYLLYRNTWARGLVLFDMYTDIIVTYGLYKSGINQIWFMLSCLFIALPFVLVWSASLRFIQNYINKLDDDSKYHYVINILLIIYMFPPIGSIFIALYEIYWVLSDIFNGTKSFIFGTGLIEAEDQQTKAMKSYRRAIEIFSESIPQTLLQLYIFLHFNIQNKSSGIHPNDLYLSLTVSFFNLCINVYRFRNEAKLHGMSWGEYALSVLQLAEVPIIKLVPRLPAIKKGLLTQVNFSGFIFDKESITPLLAALNNSKCKLKTVKLSIGSLSNLDIQSCKTLGNVLYQSNINVLISRTSSLIDIKNLFELIDEDNNGYLDENEFILALKTLNCSIQNISKQQQKRIFQRLAIRRIKKRDRVYFYDFFNKTASLKDWTKSAQIDFDLTQIDLPIHFIFLQIKQLIFNPVNYRKESVIIKNMKKLYQFCLALNIMNKIDGVGNHIFYGIVAALHAAHTVSNSIVVKQSKIAELYKLIWMFFLDLLESPQFDSKLYLKRNSIFKHLDIENTNVNNAFSRKLKMESYTGYNVFETCFVYKEHIFQIKNNQCKAFANLLDAFLKKSTSNYLKNLISPNGQLYHLYVRTNGFHIMDDESMTILKHAVHHSLNDVIKFFAEYIIKSTGDDQNVYDEKEEEKDEQIKNDEIQINLQWTEDQDYMHSVLEKLFGSCSKHRDVESLKILLSTNKININYYKDHYTVKCILKKIKGDNDSDGYLLKCLEILDEFEYGWLNHKNVNGNNILHNAAYHGRHSAVISKMIDIFKKKKSWGQLSNLLNDVNNKDQTPFIIAMDSGCGDTASVLAQCMHQTIDIEKYISTKSGDISKYTEKDKLWINSLHAVIANNDGKIPNNFSKTGKEKLYNLFKRFFSYLQDKQTEKTNKSNVFSRLFADNKQNENQYQNVLLILSFLQKDLEIKMDYDEIKIYGFVRKLLTKKFGDDICDVIVEYYNRIEIDYGNKYKKKSSNSKTVKFSHKALVKQKVIIDVDYDVVQQLKVKINNMNYYFTQIDSDHFELEIKYKVGWSAEISPFPEPFQLSLSKLNEMLQQYQKRYMLELFTFLVTNLIDLLKKNFSTSY